MKLLSYNFVEFLLIISIIIFLSLPAMTMELEGGIALEEDENKLNVIHLSSNFTPDYQPTSSVEGPNKAYITQIEDSNVTAIEQIGVGNIADVLQIGSDNLANIYQDGNKNKAYIEQVGDDLVANIEQYGNGHYASIDQPDEDPVKHEIIQKGNNNSASTSMFSRSGLIRIKQIGNNLNLNMDLLFSN